MASQNGNGTQKVKAGRFALGSHIFLPDGTVRFVGGFSEADHFDRGFPFVEYSKNKKQNTLANASIARLESGLSSGGSTFDWIREAGPDERLKLAEWNNGIISIRETVEHYGKFLSPENLPIELLRCVRFPQDVRPYGSLRKVHDELAEKIQANVDLSASNCRLLAYFILATWLWELLPVAPFVSIFGPISSGKSTLLRVLGALSYRAAYVTDISNAALYRLVDLAHPTLLIDEFESGSNRSNTNLYRLLRASFTPGSYVARFGSVYNLFGPRILCSELPLTDDGLRSRCIEINMLPGKNPKHRVNVSNIEELANVFQPKLMALRLSQFQTLKEKKLPIRIPSSLGPRMADIFRALALPISDDQEMLRKLGQLLAAQNSVARADREQQPQHLVAEILFSLCHFYKRTVLGPRGISEILVGGVADAVQEVVYFRGGQEIYGARRVGAILKSLGLRTIRLGRMGRGFHFSRSFQEQIHDLAVRFEITRRDIGSIDVLSSNHGGYRCELCDKFNLGAGLKFVDYQLPKRHHTCGVPRNRRPLFGKCDPELSRNARGAEALVDRDQPKG